MEDDAVRERHGCSCREPDLTGTSVTVWEGEEYVHLDSCYKNRVMTPHQARYLASKLYRLSRRIRNRSAEA